MIKLFLLCSGLGNVQRGYESFFQECFSVLSQEHSLDVTLFKGGGYYQEKSITLWNMSRSTWMAIQIGNLVKTLSESLHKGDYFLRQGGYFIEEASFVFSLLPYIHRQAPDVIYFSDDGLGYLLWHWRRLTKQNYKLLFRNGGPFSPPFTRWNHVQHLTPTSFQNTLNYKEPAAKHTLLPSGFNIPSELQMLSVQEREVLRNRLGLPKEKHLILSVAAINSFHKRVDYIIHEVATLPEPRPFLLLLGQKEKESDKLIKLGNQLLGSDNFQIRTVPRNQVDDYYRIADVFVLASLREAFGRVFVEAMSYGLPCLAHDYDIPRYVLGKEGYFGNFELSGTLANLITKVLTESQDKHKRLGYHRSVYDRFSWEQLRSAYVDMIHRCAAGT